MRLWSISPHLLDSKGLVALWREALLAKKVLEGNTKGYKNHPQLERFKVCAQDHSQLRNWEYTNKENALIAINSYLWEIWFIADKRGFNFQKSKIDHNYLKGKFTPITLNIGQMTYEWGHFLKKVAKRDPIWYDKIKDNSPIPHGSFLLKIGPVESWEVIKE